MNIVTLTKLVINTIDKPVKVAASEVDICIAFYRDGDLGKLLYECRDKNVISLVKGLISTSFAIHKGFRFIAYDKLLNLMDGRHEVVSVGLDHLTEDETFVVNEFILQFPAEQIK